MLVQYHGSVSPSVSLRVLAVMIFGVVGKADEVETALRLFYTGKIDEGITALRTAAEKDHVPAQLLLGKVYGGNSKIHKEDYAEATKWYRRASALGSGEASALVAELYESGLGVATSAEEARKWWEIAASQGWDQQQMTVQCLELKDGQDATDLSCRASSEIVPCPSTEKMALLREAGLRGVLIPNGSGARFRKGPRAEALIVIDGPVKVPVKLKQPRHTTAVYFQDSGSWKHFPSDIPLLEREIVIGPQDRAARYVAYSVKDVDGSTTRGGCAIQP